MDYTKALIECIRLQDTMNSTVNKNWRNADYHFHLAALVELGEYADHIGYKWWKKQTPDYEQAFIEVVDMLHFVLSDLILAIDYNDDDDTSFDDVISMTNMFVDETQDRMDEQKLDIISMAYASIAVSDEFSNIISILYDLANICGKTKDDLLRTYIAKNTLNIFRQKKGYKEGTYVKEWFGQEDNVVLWNLLLEEPSLIEDPAELMQRLYAIYQEVLNAQN